MKAWHHIERAADLAGTQPETVFRDLLELKLLALLSLTDNIERRGGSAVLASPQLSGRHEDAYMALVTRYGAREGQQARPIDAMVSAWGEIQAETEQSGVDVLGAVFMEHVTRGDHGQFFTPECITSLMASLAGEVQAGQQVLDPACGSGRMLLDMASKQPLAEFHGVDIDERCAMMCALNFWMRDLAGRVTWGNALTNETRKAWSVSRGGWVREVRHDEAEARPAGRLF